jgi:hypothetical protein
VTRTPALRPGVLPQPLAARAIRAEVLLVVVPEAVAAVEQLAQIEAAG